MIVVKPFEITDEALVSNIPEPDTGEAVWDDQATYNTGDEVIKTETHRVYRSATDANTDDPEKGVLADPPTWVDIAPTNRYAMFDGVISRQSVSPNSISVEITAGELINGVAMFNISSLSANVTMTDPIEGEVYNTDIELRDNSEVDDYYAYFFSPILQKTEFILLDLPPYPNATIGVTLTNTGSDVKAGEVVIGKQTVLGVAEYGTSLSLMDFSVRERDEFGNFIVNRRRTSKLVDFDGYVGTGKVGYVFKQLDKLTTIPCVWSGNPEQGSDITLVYGYYKDMTINISNPSTSSVTIQIEGLI